MTNTLDNNRLLVLLGKPPTDIKGRVNEVVEATFVKLEAKLDQTFKRCEITYDLKGRTAGMAYSLPPEIKLNLQLLLDSRYTEDMLNDTVPHEVCHIVQRQLAPRSKAHGHEWQRLMYLIGLEPTRCHNYEVAPVRKHARPHRYECDCRVHMVTNLIHTKIQSGQVRTCLNCKGRLR